MPVAMVQDCRATESEVNFTAQEVQTLAGYYREHHELIKGIKDAESAERQIQRIEELFTEHSELLQSANLHNEAQTACGISPEQEEAERNRLISAHCYGNTKLAEHLFDRKAAALPPQELPPHIIERLNNRVHTSKLPEVQGLQGGPGFTAETAWQPGNTYFSGELRTLEPVSFVILTNRCDDDEVLYTPTLPLDKLAPLLVEALLDLLEVDVLCCELVRPLVTPTTTPVKTAPAS